MMPKRTRMKNKTRLGVVIPSVVYKNVKMSLLKAVWLQTTRAQELGIAPPDPLAVREKLVVATESGFKCPYCGIGFEWGSPTFHPTIDHRVPVSRGGNNDTDNLVFCCARCNQLKCALTTEEYMSLVMKVNEHYRTSWTRVERFDREIRRLKKEMG
jgi:5-methylcytosine-specific restriction endonuclease McrA